MFRLVIKACQASDSIKHTPKNTDAHHGKTHFLTSYQVECVSPSPTEFLDVHNMGTLSNSKSHQFVNVCVISSAERNINSTLSKKAHRNRLIVSYALIVCSPPIAFGLACPVLTVRKDRYQPNNHHLKLSF